MQTDTPNIANIDTAIAIMKRAAKHNRIDMRSWQTRQNRNSNIATTEAELHACGNTACFAGYVAVSPEWKAAGGTIGGSGTPLLLLWPDISSHYAIGKSAIAAWLGIRQRLAESLVCGDTYLMKDIINYQHSSFYDKPWKEVTAEDVIAKLELIKSGELK